MAKDPFSDEAENFLSGNRTPNLVWPKVGHQESVTLISWEMVQSQEYQTGEPLFWDGKTKVTRDTGKPVRYMRALVLQDAPTGLAWEGKDYEEVVLEEDDGYRTLHIDKPALRAAVQDAFKEAKAKLEPGAHLTLSRVKSTRKARTAGFSNPHAYAAVWVPASGNSLWPDIQKRLAENEAPEEDPFG